MYSYNFAIISHFKRAYPFIWTNQSPPSTMLCFNFGWILPTVSVWRRRRICQQFLTTTTTTTTTTIDNGQISVSLSARVSLEAACLLLQIFTRIKQTFFLVLFIFFIHFPGIPFLTFHKAIDHCLTRSAGAHNFEAFFD